MKRFKNLVIGGIQNKVFNLILLALILLTAAFSVVSLYHTHMLENLAARSNVQQQEAIENITTAVMDQVVVTTMERSSKTEALIANDMFNDVRNRIRFVAGFVEAVFKDPVNYPQKPLTGPDPSQDGQWTAKAIYAEGTVPEDPAVSAKVDLLARLTDALVALCPSLEADNIYIAVPEGVHYTVSTTSSSWFVDGELRRYDPRQRQWYRQAVEAGDLIFTDGEFDAVTGVYCVECAMPVYDADGELLAVVGTDLFLDKMQQILLASLVENETQLLVNQDGRAVLSLQAENFPIAEEDRTGDLRASRIPLLAEIADSALQGQMTGVAQGPMLDGTDYYIIGMPIETPGWTLISAYKQEVARQPVVMLQGSYDQIQRQVTDTYRENTNHSQAVATVLMIVVTVLMLTGALVLAKRIVAPLNTITRRISELREGNLEFKMENAYRTGDEIEELAQSFANLSHKTVEYVETVKRVTAEKERIGAELSLATDIQAAMLPHIFPAFPDRKEFDIYASMDPAKEVGGDFYDYFLIDDDHLCMVIADVSGKGVPAALFMMASKIILQSVAMLGRSPAEILTKTNEAICSNNEAQMFVTVWLGILELSTGKLTAANAGHEYPTIKRPDGSFEIYKDRHGFVIGGMEGAKYREYELQLEPGAKIFVYTDGVAEATNKDNELFGTERMLDALNRQPDVAPLQMLRNVRRAVDDFVQDAPQFDDLTMLCMEYKGYGEQ